MPDQLAVGSLIKSNLFGGKFTVYLIEDPGENSTYE